MRGGPAFSLKSGGSIRGQGKSWPPQGQRASASESPVSMHLPISFQLKAGHGMHPSGCLSWPITIQGFWKLLAWRSFAQTLLITSQSPLAHNNVSQPVAFPLRSLHPVEHFSKLWVILFAFLSRDPSFSCFADLPRSIFRFSRHPSVYPFLSPSDVISVTSLLEKEKQVQRLAQSWDRGGLAGKGRTRATGPGQQLTSRSPGTRAAGTKGPMRGAPLGQFQRPPPSERPFSVTWEG